MAFGAKIYLYINFLLGNDTIVQLSADKYKFSLSRDQQADVNFKAVITSNPFCKAECNYQFKDISNNEIIDQSDFSLKPGTPFNKKYTIQEENLGTGQELYRFDIECKSTKTILCNTQEENSTKNILLTIDYDLTEEDKQYINNLKIKLENISFELNYMGNQTQYLDLLTKRFNDTLTFNISENATADLIDLINENKNKSEDLNSLWQNQEYNLLQTKIENYENINNLEEQFKYLNEIIINSIEKYNLLVNILNKTSLDLINLKSKSLNETQTNELNNLIKDFNKTLILFASNSQIIKTESSVLDTRNKTAKFLLNLKESSVPSNISILEVPKLINYPLLFNQTILLNKTFIDYPSPRCCIFGKCQECCITNECKNSKENYPIVFLHGHAFNSNLPVEFNLDGFTKIQENLETEGYLNAGAISLYSESPTDNFLSKIPVPLTIKASYYYDSLKQSDSYTLVQRKSETIDAYAIRLNELIKDIEIKTERPKVIIIAHSMGGLVARRYVQLFGADKVEKLILIGTPNKGIEGDIANYCSIFGEKLECRDMNSNSFFMNKLNRDLPNVPIYMIYGTGCNMNGEDGDGIVLTRNAILENANNSKINGQCGGVNFLHTEMLNPALYPKVYNLIKEDLNAS